MPPTGQPPPPRSAPSWWAAGILGLSALGAIVLLYFFDPATTDFYPACPLHSLTGLDCPACGGLRAAHLLLHGQVRAAFRLNPFLFFALPVAGLFAFRPALARARWLPWAALASLIAYFLWRNFA
jgi:hypothetical protein